MTDTEKIKEGPKVDKRPPSFLCTLKHWKGIEKLKVEWSNKKAPNMQEQRFRRRADGRFQGKIQKRTSTKRKGD